MKKSVKIIIIILVLVTALVVISSYFFPNFFASLSLGKTSNLGGELTSLLINPNSPVSYWKFENNTLDSNGNFDGALYGNSVFVSGKIGNALAFDGVNDCVYLPTSSGTSSPLNIYNTDLTLGAWVRYNGFGNTIVTRAKPNYVTYWLRIEGNKACARVYKSAKHYMVCTNTTLNPGTWYYITGVFDRVNNQARVYVDGVLKASGSLPDAPSGNSGTTKIGCRNSNTDMQFNGIIDEVKIWNYALSDSEIWSEYNSVPTNQTCTDSDSGLNYNIKGITSYSNGTSETDFCTLASKILIEYYCDNNLIKSSNYNCTSAGKTCSNGACVNQTCTPKTCAQLGKSCGIWSDGCGTNINCGSCGSGRYCSATGQCVFNNTCLDSDDGQVYNVKGTVSGYLYGGYYNNNDTCISNLTLREYYCLGNYQDNSTISCSGNYTQCSNGRCI